MGLAHAHSVTLSGIQGQVVEVEADVGPGVPGVALVGLPDTALNESRDRIKAAFVNSMIEWPRRRVTINLSPASLRKSGSHFDLAIAATLLAADGTVPSTRLHRTALLGELALDGRVRAVRGVLPATLAAAQAGLTRVVVPRDNVREARLVRDVEVVPVTTAAGLLAWLRGAEPEDDGPAPEPVAADPAHAPDLSDVAGQQQARFALEVAASGGHHVFLLGPPGGGKTMLAERLPGLLPALTDQESLEVSAIHSVAGILPAGQPLVSSPPFRAPHHSATMPALLGGGGGGSIRPGEISLAHRGTLFLDEAPEFDRRTLDALRQPLESGSVVVSRAAGEARFPARVVLVLAANPCPCGGAQTIGGVCECTSLQRRRYLHRMSGPLLDRVDLRLTVYAATRAELLDDLVRGESTALVAQRVAAARERMERRLAGTPWRTNAEVPGRELRNRFAVPAAARAVLSPAVERGALSARGVDRVLRVAWTLADLAGVDVPTADETARALSLRVDDLRRVDVDVRSSRPLDAAARAALGGRRA
jgi:magnesium chelatase family protein